MVKIKSQTFEESVIMAMDGSDKELFPYMPYILQDLWEMGSDPDTIITLINKNLLKHEDLKVLDLGCGKGAVSIRVADKFKCQYRGIDAIEDFILYARIKAIEYKVDELCLFEVGDIRESIKKLPRYDVIILGSIGPVFGDYQNTLTTLKKHLNENGIIIIDDAYIEDESEFSHPLVLKHKELIKQINACGLRLVETVSSRKENVADMSNTIHEKVKKRCFELADLHPDKKKLFMDFISLQEYQIDIYTNKVICSTFVIKK